MPADAPDLPPALRSLMEAGGALVRRSASGRMSLARAAGVVPADALPRAMRRLPATLEHAREQACVPLDRQVVEKLLKSAWGQTPDAALKRWDPEPVAVTAAAQVHRGATEDGAVAIKVRRPGLASAVRNDLALLDALSRPLGQVLGALDTGAMLREVRESALDELDLEHEASTSRQARRALRGVAGLVVPAPDLDLCGEDVLVTEWLDGSTLQEAAPEDPGAVARILVAAHLAAARTGLLLADPRPGHVVLLDGGRVGLLGCGVARPADRGRVSAALEALAALRAGDEAAFATAVHGSLGLLPEAEAQQAFVVACELLGPLLLRPARLDGSALAAAGERALERLGALLALGAEITPVPQDLAALRSLGQLTALLSGLGATEDWGALALA